MRPDVPPDSLLFVFKGAGIDGAQHAESAYEIPTAGVGHAPGLSATPPRQAADSVERGMAKDAGDHSVPAGHS